MDRVESPFRSRESNFQVLEDSNSGHVYNTPQYLPTSVHVSNSGTSSTGSGCSVLGLAGEINVLFLPIPLLNKCAIQEAEVTLIAPWWPTQL